MATNFFTGVPSTQDMGDKIALICLLVQIYNKLKKAKPKVTLYEVACALSQGTIDKDLCKQIAGVCEDFMNGCTKFPDLCASDKEAVEKIKQLFSQLLPF